MFRHVLLLCLLFFSLDADAAVRFVPKSSMLNAEQVTDPNPLPGDVRLPMPGELHMILRPVCLPATGYLDATEMQHGVQESLSASALGERTESSGDRGQYADHVHTLSMSAPFEMKDFPSVWGEDVRRFLSADPACAASQQSGMRSYVYFMGKYEVSRAQWRAVMNMRDGSSPFAFEADDYLPMTRVSWFDVLEFTRRYSEWLMEHHPEYLPFFEQEKRSSYIRLPSEGEWEFAARGGHRASPADLSHTVLHPISEGADIRDYIVSLLYDSTLSGPAPIGSRKPNPLGLYDMLGNCSEMVCSPFQLVAGGRLVGGYGGFIIKGGSWRATEMASLHPGQRLEAAYYVDGKAQARDDMGFRISLGGILTPKERRGDLYKEWIARSRPQAAGADAQNDDVRVVIRDIVQRVEDPELKRRLAQAEAVASLYHEKVNESEERMIRETLLGALFSLETIANYGSRCFQLVSLMEAYDTLSEKRQVEHAGEISNMKKEIHGFTEGIRGALFYYRAMVREASRFEDGRLLPQLEKVSLQFVHEDGFSRSMSRRVAVLRKHLERKVDSPLEERKALADILPDWLLQKINPYW